MLRQQQDEPLTKVYTDAAWNASRQSAGLGWVFSDAQRPAFWCGNKAEDYVGSLLIAEALAIRLALMEAQNMGINDVHVNSDLQVLIRVIQKKELIKELVGILQDIYELSCCFSYISRTDNFSADSLAKRALCAFIAS